jgi:hypothetical protein
MTTSTLRHPSNRVVFEAPMHRWIDLGMGKESDFVSLMPHVSHARTFLLVPRYSYVEHFDHLVRITATTRSRTLSQIEAKDLHDAMEDSSPYIALGLASGDLTSDSSARHALAIIRPGHAYSVFESLAHLVLISPTEHNWILPSTSYKSDDFAPAMLWQSNRQVLHCVYRSIGYAGARTPWYRKRAGG